MGVGPVSGGLDPNDLEALRRAVPQIYDRAAAAWDGARGRGLVERPWIDRAVAGLKPGAPVLDLGAGTGEPIAAFLVTLGLAVTGLDIAPAMVRVARERVPAASWEVGDMRQLARRERFGAIIAWDSFFHLSPDEQRATLPRLVAHLTPGGRLLLTVGPRPGEPVGRMDGQPLYHASLAAGEYVALARASGAGQVTMRAEDPDCGLRSILLVARRL